MKIMVGIVRVSVCHKSGYHRNMGSMWRKRRYHTV